MAGVTLQPGGWITNPSPGESLHIKAVTEALGLSQADLARVTRISKSAICQILSHNSWPIRTPREQLQARLHTAMASAGTSPDDLAALFYGQAAPTLVRAQASPSDELPDHNSARLTPESEPDVLLPKQTLTPLAARHFKLFRNPFDGAVDRDDQFFANDEIRYVREAAWQCAQNAGFMAVIGESGAGKSTIQADLEERLAEKARSVVVMKPGVLGMEETNRAGQMLKSADVLHAIISTLAASHAMPQTLQARTLRAQKLLMASADAGNVHLLVVEEAHGMPDSTLKHMKRLHEMRNGRRNLLGILLLAQPELKVRLTAGLRSGTLREVAQRCEIVELLPLDDALRAYLECRATAVGRQLDTVIEPAAVLQLRARLTRKTNTGVVSMAYPLAVNNMLTRAMNLAAEIGAPLVTLDVIKAI